MAKANEFPKDPNLWDTWKQFCNNKITWTPTRSSVICSNHFETSGFQVLANNRRKLVEGTKPTLTPDCICPRHQKLFTLADDRLSSDAISATLTVPHSLTSPCTSITPQNKPLKRFRESSQSQTKAETSSINSDESVSHIDPQSNETSSSAVKTSNTQALKHISYVSLKDETRKPDFKTIKIQANESTSNNSLEDESSNPDVETIDTQALKVTLARIRANPQLYIGIPKNCYHLIDIIHEQTDIPTTHILLCLKKIKLDTHFEELADQFGITANEASDIFTSNVPALANILHSFVDSQDLQIPLRSENTTCVIDSLEINVQPSSGNSRELTQTERGNTVKYVVCCTPDGYINYVSPGYGGRQSDEGLLEDTKYLDRLKSGDSVVPNGLRNVESMLLQKGLKVGKPRAKQKDAACFLAPQNSSTNELSEDQVMRLVQRIREFTMFKYRSGLSCELVRVLDEAVVISCALINLQSFVIN